MSYLKNLLGENEQIVFVTRQHWLVLLGQILGKSVLALGLVILITLIWRIWLPQSLIIPLAYLLLILPLLGLLGKVTNPAWTGDKAGAAITGFVRGALSKTGGEHPDVQLWYAWFLQHLVLPYAAFWSYLVAWGEVLVGIALILGIFTGLAAFFGGFMNANYLLAGTVSTNPTLFAVATLLVLAWKTAGWWGLDRWLLPLLGTPWRPGPIFHHDDDKPGDPALAHSSVSAS